MKNKPSCPPGGPREVVQWRESLSVSTLAGSKLALAVALLHRLADEIDKRRGRR